MGATDDLQDEDRICALALGKSIAFIFYSFLVMFAAVAAVEIFKPDVPASIYPVFTVTVLFAAGEVLLVPLVVSGSLPGTSSSIVTPIPERHISYAMTALSIGVWLFARSALEARVLHYIINGMLVLAAAVYFVVKSTISRRPRWGVLTLLFAPVLEYAVDQFLQAH